MISQFTFINSLLIPTITLAVHELEGRDLAPGQMLYVERCASCHGAALEGQPNWQRQNDAGTMPAPPHDENGDTQHQDGQLLFTYTRLGAQGALADRGITNFQSGMPGFANVISDDEIWVMLAYMRSTWPERVQES